MLRHIVFGIMLALVFASFLKLTPSYAVETRVYPSPDEIILTTYTSGVDTRFNVTVCVENVANVGGVQVYLEFNDTILSVTRWIEPTNDPQYIFYGRPTSALPTPPDPGYLHLAPNKGRVLISTSLFPPNPPYFTGNGKVCMFEFSILAVPGETGTMFASALNISFEDTYVIDGDTGNEIPGVIKENGYYEISKPSAPPPPPAQPAHIWLEASPSVFKARRLKPFNVSVTVQNVSETDALIGIQFKISYNSTALSVVNIIQGDFLNRSYWAPSGTFLSIADDIGTVVYGEMISSNENNEWNPPFPEGNGTAATITFLPLLDEAANFTLRIEPIEGQFFLNKNGDYVDYASAKGCRYAYIPIPNILGDVNHDGQVDLRDVYSVAKAFGSCPGRPNWDSECDINVDNKVDILDCYLVWKNYGRTA